MKKLYWGIVGALRSLRSKTKKGYYKIMLMEAGKPSVRKYLDKVMAHPSMLRDASGDFHYEFSQLPVYDELNRLYPLREKAGDGDTFTRAVNLMGWLCSNTQYSGYSAYDPSKPEKQFLKLMEYAFQNKFSHAVNCAALAIALSDCLMAVGIHAIPVWQAAAHGSGFWHVTVHVFLPEEGRWVMLDPSFALYLTDGAGRALDLMEARDRYLRNEPLTIARYNLNGGQFFRDKYLSTFLMPCSFEFSLWRGNAPELRNPSRMVYLIPEGVEPEDASMTLISQEQLLASPSGGNYDHRL